MNIHNELNDNIVVINNRFENEIDNEQQDQGNNIGQPNVQQEEHNVQEQPNVQQEQGKNENSEDAKLLNKYLDN